MAIRSRLSLIQSQHVYAAAAHYARHPEERSHSNRWSAEVKGKFYTLRDLLRHSASLVGWSIRGDELPRFEGRWRKKLESMPGVVVHDHGIKVTQEGRVSKGNGKKPRPGDINAENVRAAAKVWDKGRGFMNFGAAKKFQVWIDAAGDGILQPYPVKAIVSLAARDAGRRPLRTNEFAGANDGIWHRHFKDTLGFRVLPIGQSPNGLGEAIPVVLKGEQRGSRGAVSMSANELKDTLKKGGKVLAPKDPADVAIERLLKRGRLPTEAKRQVRARLGQGTFRSALLAAYGECALTGEPLPEVLRAAHIQRWADSDEDLEARLDLHNGLLLSANLDCLFEVGLIAIDAKGNLLISDELDDDTCTRLGICPGMPLRWPISARRAAYFKIHRERVGFEADDEDDEDPASVSEAFTW